MDCAAAELSAYTGAEFDLILAIGDELTSRRCSKGTPPRPAPRPPHIVASHAQARECALPGPRSACAAPAPRPRRRGNAQPGRNALSRLRLLL